MTGVVVVVAAALVPELLATEVELVEEKIQNLTKLYRLTKSRALNSNF